MVRARQGWLEEPAHRAVVDAARIVEIDHRRAALSTERGEFDFSPWRFWSEADAAARAQQIDLQRRMVEERPDHVFGEQCFISRLASVDNEALRLGARSYIAAGAYLTETSWSTGDYAEYIKSEIANWK